VTVPDRSRRSGLCGLDDLPERRAVVLAAALARALVTLGRRADLGAFGGRDGGLHRSPLNGGTLHPGPTVGNCLDGLTGGAVGGARTVGGEEAVAGPHAGPDGVTGGDVHAGSSGCAVRADKDDSSARRTALSSANLRCPAIPARSGPGGRSRQPPPTGPRTSARSAA